VLFSEAVLDQIYRKAMEIAAGGDAASAVLLLKAASVLGHRRATACVAECRLCPYGGIQGDARQAVATLTQLWRDHNDPTAIVLLGLYQVQCRSVGAKIPDDAVCASALAALTVDCEAWDLFGLYVIAQCYCDGVGCTADPQRGFRSFQALAGRGYLSAVEMLGVCFEHGDGIATDYMEAVKWYQVAADQGDSVAQHNLGLCFEQGKGVAKSTAQAARWYRLAAAQGNDAALFNLGVCFEHGKGIAKSPADAARLYRLSAAQGNQRAIDALQRLGL
jgi:TPR repeat protein